MAKRSLPRNGVSQHNWITLERFRSEFGLFYSEQAIRKWRFVGCPHLYSGRKLKWLSRNDPQTGAFELLIWRSDAREISLSIYGPNGYLRKNPRKRWGTYADVLRLITITRHGLNNFCKHGEVGHYREKLPSSGWTDFYDLDAPAIAERMRVEDGPQTGAGAGRYRLDNSLQDEQVLPLLPNQFRDDDRTPLTAPILSERYGIYASQLKDWRRSCPALGGKPFLAALIRKGNNKSPWTWVYDREQAGIIRQHLKALTKPTKWIPEDSVPREWRDSRGRFWTVRRLWTELRLARLFSAKNIATIVYGWHKASCPHIPSGILRVLRVLFKTGKRPKKVIIHPQDVEALTRSLGRDAIPRMATSGQKRIPDGKIYPEAPVASGAQLRPEYKHKEEPLTCDRFVLFGINVGRPCADRWRSYCPYLGRGVRAKAFIDDRGKKRWAYHRKDVESISAAMAASAPDRRHHKKGRPSQLTAPHWAAATTNSGITAKLGNHDGDISIESLGDRKYRVGDYLKVVTQTEDKVLQAFIENNHMDSEQLNTKLGFDHARVVLNQIRKKYLSFAECIACPGRKALGGYYVSVRSVENPMS